MKSQLRELIDKTLKSPPSRGAWIEMRRPKTTQNPQLGRPPRGGRGLKYRGRRMRGAG